MSRGQIGLRTLNGPVDPYLELVFVHGLMGDSSLTWTFENDRATFWPEWLAEDPEFSNLRIHTYGYHEPPVNGRAPVSKLRDMGAALCSALELNSQFRGSTHVSYVSGYDFLKLTKLFNIEPSHIHCAFLGRSCGEGSE